eukprot:5235694-Ditylum_brightwellii.AAC.1
MDRKYISYIIYCITYLARGGITFQGHDEKQSSKNPGNFLCLIRLLSKYSPDFKSLFVKRPEN